MKKAAYITTTLPYVNAEPHIGFAFELVQADVLARFWRQQGLDVVFNTGTDEHGLKIYKKAIEEKKDPQAYTDEYAAKFEKLQEALNLTYTNFIRTTNASHKLATQEFWKRCAKNGDIYKKTYKIKYCVGCELEKTESELVNNHCLLHPNQELEIIEEENYFFKFSRYQKQLLKLYTDDPNFIVPDFRLKEIYNFVARGLEDFSISRLKSKMSWGVDVPGDPDHVMYVWFDALVNYISTLGWPKDEIRFKQFWPGIQIAGKDNLRQQAAMWQAMLISVGLPNTKQIIIHGFITSGGQKMSKSLGNVIDPFKLVKQWGTDAVRYYLLREIPTFDDGDYSNQRMEEVYNADLANDLGNLLSRITTIAEKDNLILDSSKKNEWWTNEEIKLFDRFEFNKVLELLWLTIKKINKSVNDFAPWDKSKEERNEFLTDTLLQLNHIGHQFLPFIPQTAEKIIAATQDSIKKSESLFPKPTH